MTRSQPPDDSFALDRGSHRVTHGAGRSRTEAGWAGAIEPPGLAPKDYAPADPVPAEWEQDGRGSRRATRSRDPEVWDPDNNPAYEMPRRSPPGNRRSQSSDEQRRRRG